MKKILLISLFLAFGFLVLVVSILRSASLRHSSNFSSLSSSLNLTNQELSVDYYFASAGGVLPDHPLWGLKVLRDKFWLFLTPGLTRKSELNLLFSDKRLMAAKILNQRGKYDLAYSTIFKSQNYFMEAVRLEEEARKKGDNTDELLLLLTKSSLAHKEVIISLQDAFSDDLKSQLTPLVEYLSNYYDRSSSYLKSKNILVK